MPKVTGHRFLAYLIGEVENYTEEKRTRLDSHSVCKFKAVRSAFSSFQISSNNSVGVIVVVLRMLNWLLHHLPLSSSSSLVSTCLSVSLCDLMPLLSLSLSLSLAQLANLITI